MNIWVSSHSTQTIPAAARVCAHICRAIYEISEPSLAHAQGLFMDSASQIKVQHVPRATGQGLAHAAGQAGQGWGAQPPSTSPVKGFPHRQKGRGAGGTASTDTAQSVYLGGHFLEAQESAKKL